MTKRKEGPKSNRAPIVLDDLLPKRDVTGRNGSSVVFGVLSQDETSTKEKNTKRRRKGHETP